MRFESITLCKLSKSLITGSILIALILYLVHFKCIFILLILIVIINCLYNYLLMLFTYFLIKFIIITTTIFLFTYFFWGQIFTYFLSHL